MNVIIFGPPGAGKGTQAKNIVKKFNLYQVSTGDILREEIKKKSKIGKQIANIISKGDFVTDDIINTLLNKIVINPLYRNRIIFDGYPRNITQANTLEKMIKNDNQNINFVLFLKASREIIEKRIMGRITCEKCHETLNEYFDNREDIKNHKCGNTFFKKRKDDNQGAITTRYRIYIEKTKPILDFYFSRSYFHEINGDQKIEVITSKIEQILSV